MSIASSFWKKVFAFFVCALLILAQIQVLVFMQNTAYADDPTNPTETTSVLPASGTIGQGCTWTIDATGKLTIEAANGQAGTLSDDETHTFTTAFGSFKEQITEVEINPNVTLGSNLSYLFSGCTNLRTVHSQNWSTSQVTQMDCMFDSCKNLTTIDTSNWNTSNVTNMDRMFGECSSLASIDVSKWNTAKVTNFDKIF